MIDERSLRAAAATQIQFCAPVRLDLSSRRHVRDRRPGCDSLDGPMMPFDCRSLNMAATGLDELAPSPTNMSPPAPPPVSAPQVAPGAGLKKPSTENRLPVVPIDRRRGRGHSPCRCSSHRHARDLPESVHSSTCVRGSLILAGQDGSGVLLFTPVSPTLLTSTPSNPLAVGPS